MALRFSHPHPVPGPHVVRRQHPRPEPVLIHAHELHLSHLRASNRHPRTLAWHDLVIRRYEAWYRVARGVPDVKPVPLAALEVQSARRFVVYLREEYHSVDHLHGLPRTIGPKTILEHVRAMKALTRWLVTEEVIDRDPLANLQIPRVPRRVVPVFTESQVKLLISAIEHRPNRTRNLALLFLLLSTGARISEAVGLSWGDLDFKERRAKVMGKGSKERWLQFDQPTTRLLMRLRTENGVTSGPVFLTREGVRMKSNTAQLIFNAWGEEAGLDECHPHVCRHTFATVFLRNNPGQILQLQELLGHSSLSMTSRYVKFVEATSPVHGPSVIESLHLDRYAR